MSSTDGPREAAPLPAKPPRRRRTQPYTPDDLQPMSTVTDVLGKKTAPDTLYHYTTTAGLAGIIRERGLWLSHVSFLNDRSEMVYARDLVLRTLSERTTGANERVAPFLQEVAELLPEMFSGLDPFIGCFCADGDLLSQWRGYSKGGGMYALGFASSALLADQRFGLLPVIYDAVEQQRMVDESLDKGIRRFLVPMKMETRTELGLLGPAQTLAIALSIWFTIFKDVSFSEEREWRMSLLPRDIRGSTYPLPK